MKQREKLLKRRRRRRDIRNPSEFDKKIWGWVHKEPDNIKKINRRAIFVAISPLLIGSIMALILIAIIDLGGRL